MHPRTDGHTLPAANADQLVQLVKRWGVTAEELLSGSGLSETDAQDPRLRISLHGFSALAERARALTGEPGLGFYLGLQKRISMYGYLGFAAMSAASLGEALELFVRFLPTLTTSLSFELTVERGVASITVREFADLGSAHDMALTSLVVGMREIGKMLTGRELKGERAEVALPEPPYFHRFAHLLPATQFDQPVTRLLFDASYLGLPLAQANRAALQLAREHCERALDALGYESDLVERTRRAVSSGGGEGFRSLAHVAKTLRVSRRTLARRLAAQGVSYSSLLDRERRERALLLLQSGRVSLEDIADQLGYSTLSSFARAFHRWTSTTPAAWRRARASEAMRPRALPAIHEARASRAVG